MYSTHLFLKEKVSKRTLPILMDLRVQTMYGRKKEPCHAGRCSCPYHNVQNERRYSSYK